MDETKIKLPLTAEELDAFVVDLTTRFNLPPQRGTYESIATTILHMPSDQDEEYPSVFAKRVNKLRANTAAYGKLQEFQDMRKKEEAEKKAADEAEKAKLTLVQPETDATGTQPA